MTTLLRLRALEVAETEAKKGIHEVGGNNRGPQVQAYLKEVGLGPGYSWCAAFVSWCYRRAAKEKQPWESAGVWNIWSYAKRHGWLRDRPYRGYLVCYDFDSNGAYNDHIGFVKRVLSLGPVLVLRTVEGNTVSDQRGSQSDGGGVYYRIRAVRRKSVSFIRVPGLVK